MSEAAGIEAALERARAAWPNLDLEPQGFTRFLEERLPGLEGLDRFAVEDLYLTYGCLLREQGAVATFMDTYGPTIEGVIRRFHPRTPAEDLKQQLLEKLFVTTGEREPKIAEYRGIGRLKNWLRVTALRMLINSNRGMKRAEARKNDCLKDLAVLHDQIDLELAIVKKHYRQAFKNAFEAAVARLDARERNYLWHKTVANHTLEQIAAIYHVHPSTISRHLDATRKKLLELTREELVERLEIDAAQFESILHLVRSGMEVSLSRLLQPETRAKGSD